MQNLFEKITLQVSIEFSSRLIINNFEIKENTKINHNIIKKTIIELTSKLNSNYFKKIKIEIGVIEKIFHNGKNNISYYTTFVVVDIINIYNEKYEQSYSHNCKHQEKILNSISVCFNIILNYTDKVSKKSKIKSYRIDIKKPINIFFRAGYTSILAHEIFGHYLQQRSNNILSKSIGKVVTSNSLSVYDDPNIIELAGYSPLNSLLEKTKRLNLIESGVLTGFYDQNLNYGSISRRESSKYPIEVRPSNTIVAPRLEYETPPIPPETLIIEKIRGGYINYKERKAYFLIELSHQNGIVFKPFIFNACASELMGALEYYGGKAITNSSMCKSFSGIVPVSHTSPNLKTIRPFSVKTNE